MHLYMRLHTVLLCYTVKAFNHVGNTNTKLLNVPILSNLLINEPKSTPDYSNAFLRRAYDVSFSALYTLPYFLVKIYYKHEEITKLSNIQNCNFCMQFNSFI